MYSKYVNKKKFTYLIISFTNNINSTSYDILKIRLPFYCTFVAGTVFSFSPLKLSAFQGAIPISTEFSLKQTSPFSFNSLNWLVCAKFAIFRHVHFFCKIATFQGLLLLCHSVNSRQPFGEFSPNLPYSLLD